MYIVKRTNYASYFCSMHQRIKGWIGSFPQRGRKVHIAGAGIAGLLAGWHLKKAGFEVKIFEKTARPGGLIHSISGKYGLVEAAANGILWSEDMHTLCKDLGITALPAQKSAAKRYILRDNTFRRLPIHISELPEVVSRLFRRHTLGVEDENLEVFGKKVLGENATRYLLQPAMYGIYGSNLSHLGVKAILPDFYQDIANGNTLLHALKNLRPVPVKGIPKGLHSFAGGMQDLVLALQQQLQDQLVFNTPAPEPKEGVHTVCTLPAFAVNDWLNPAMPGLVQEFHAVQYAPLISVTLICNHTAFRNLPEGFGVLIPAEENYTLLGVLFNHSIFPGRVKSKGLASLTCILGGQGRPDICSLGDEKIMDIVRQDLNRLLGLNEAPLEYTVSAYPQALPLYSAALPRIWNALHDKLTQSKMDLSFFGNYTGEISIRGMNSVAAGVAKQVGI